MSTWTSKQKILTGTGLVNVNSDPIAIDLRRFHFGCTIATTLVTGGAAAFKVQVSFDPQTDPPVYWNDHDILVDLVASAQSNLVFPATYCRLVAASLTGTLVMSVVMSIGTS